MRITKINENKMSNKSSAQTAPSQALVTSDYLQALVSGLSEAMNDGLASNVSISCSDSEGSLALSFYVLASDATVSFSYDGNHDGECVVSVTSEKTPEINLNYLFSLDYDPACHVYETAELFNNDDAQEIIESLGFQTTVEV